MPVNLSIKSVPDHLAAQLRRRAERNHRSLQGELMAIITMAIEATPESASISPAPAVTRRIVVGSDGRGRPIVRKGDRSMEDVAAELRRMTPRPRDDLPRSVDIIRNMRDER